MCHSDDMSVYIYDLTTNIFTYQVIVYFIAVKPIYMQSLKSRGCSGACWY